MGRVLPAVPAIKEVSMVERKELSKEEIARRAYELYVQRGSEPGKRRRGLAESRKRIEQRR